MINAGWMARSWSLAVGWSLIGWKSCNDLEIDVWDEDDVTLDEDDD